VKTTRRVRRGGALIALSAAALAFFGCSSDNNSMPKGDGGAGTLGDVQKKEPTVDTIAQPPTEVSPSGVVTVLAPPNGVRGIAVINEDDGEDFGKKDDLALYFTVYGERAITKYDGIYRWDGPNISDSVRVVEQVRPGSIVQHSKTGVIYVSLPSANKIKILDLATSALEDYAGSDVVSATELNGPVADATFKSPWGLTIDEKRDILYVVDIKGHSIRSIDLDDGMVSTLSLPAGELSAPGMIAIDKSGDLYVADTGHNQIKKIDVGLLGGTAISVVAGDGTRCASRLDPCGDGGSALEAQLNIPIGVAVQKGQILIADTYDNRIRVVTSKKGTQGATTYTIDAYAGSGVEGFADGPALSATMRWPYEVKFFDGDFDDGDDVTLSGRKKVTGALFSDSGNNAVRDDDDDDDDDLVGGSGDAIPPSMEPVEPGWPPGD
jgi:hypothetical protein